MILLTAAAAAVGAAVVMLYVHGSIPGGLIAAGGSFISVTGFLNRIIE